MNFYKVFYKDRISEVIRTKKTIRNPKQISDDCVKVQMISPWGYLFGLKRRK